MSRNASQNAEHVENRNLRLQLAQVHLNWTGEDWKNITWPDGSGFLLRYADGRVRILVSTT